MNKEDVIEKFNEMIKNSWTYAKMTNDEKNKWNDILMRINYQKGTNDDTLKGTYIQRWKILNQVYHAYLIGIGYDNFNWRCEDANN